jgi:hypothetical protein
MLLYANCLKSELVVRQRSIRIEGLLCLFPGIGTGPTRLYDVELETGRRGISAGDEHVDAQHSTLGKRRIRHCDSRCTENT